MKRRTHTPMNGNGTRLRFNAQTYLSEMEDRLSTSQKEMEARLTAQLAAVKDYCPNTSKVARTEAFVKWFLLLAAPSLAATIAALVAHILHSAN